jgi:acyl transferase domain-containing protein
MEPIAIIGMACRVPGASSLQEFWALLCEGRHGIGLIPGNRWDCERIFDSDPDKPGKINTRHGGFMDGIDLFDNDFFGISAEEARQMDPQQRIMLELTYEAVEDANLSLSAIEGTDTGVFIGVMSNDYLRNQVAGEYRHIDRNTGCGSGYCMIANRISYQFNLGGPSLAIDSACSSSLVSAFLACESLWTRQCSLALAGGVNLVLSPTLSVFYARGGLSAPDGKCRTFSADASGLGRGEGAGIVVLKRLSDAVRDGDRIYALIRGGAVNHNGRGNGMSAPNRWAQQLLLRKAYAHAGVEPRDVQYIELHGTGTLLGDAIEATALGSVLAEGRDPGHPCRVGSAKTNLAHLEGAAGVAGLIKMALCLSHDQLVRSLWFKAPNPHIAFDTLHLQVQNRRQDWRDNGRPRVAGISSFGLGGANAHLVLQSAGTLDATLPSRPPMSHVVLQLSARSEAALLQMAGRYNTCIQNLSDEEFSALCHTTLVRPQLHDHRATLVAHNRDEMARCLYGLTSATGSPNAFRGRYCEVPRRKCLFIFPEIDVVDLSTVEALSKLHPCFKQALARCDQALKEVLRCHPGTLLADLCEPSTTPDNRFLPFVHLGVQTAIAALWQAAGIEADAVAGSGVGQVAAWLTSGAIDINSAFARIASVHHHDLTRSGSACLAQTRPFLMDCYSISGKNITPEDVGLMDARPLDREQLNSFVRMAGEREVDCFVLSMCHAQPRFEEGPDSHAPVLTAVDAQRFWLELARLSVRHNIQWKNFMDSRALACIPGYPWQHSSFWMDAEPTQGKQAAQFESKVATAAAVDSQESANSFELSASKREHPDRERPIAAQSRFVSDLNPEKLLNLPESERRSALASYLKEQLAVTLKLSADQMEEPQSFTGLGIDSLAALQLKNRVESDLKMPVSVVKLLDGHSIDDLAADLLSHGLPSPASVAEGDRSHDADGSSTQEHDAHLARVKEMSPEDIDQMLRQLLAAQACQGQASTV